MAERGCFPRKTTDNETRESKEHLAKKKKGTAKGVFTGKYHFVRYAYTYIHSHINACMSQHGTKIKDLNSIA